MSNTDAIENIMMNTGTTPQEIQLLQLLSGLSGQWGVDRVVVNHEERCIHIWARHPAGAVWRCPECTYEGSCRDHAAERTWRHSDCCNFRVYLRGRIPRVACPQHGVRQVHVPWADPDSRFTRHFERFALQLLQTCSVTGCAVILGLTWDEARGIHQRRSRRRREQIGTRARQHVQGEAVQSASEARKGFSSPVTVQAVSETEYASR